ncbi:hypothetical protein Tco_0050423, partial [Tanacetum coccineum]
MRELRENTFSGNKNDDAREHVERILDIVNLFNIPGFTHDAVMLRVFLITLTGAAKRWVDRLPPKNNQHMGLAQEGVHSKGLDTMARQLLDSQGPIPNKTPAQALVAIQTMADHSQKRHDGSTSKKVSNSSSDRTAATANKLDSLGRDMEKLKENVHAIQVGCETCRGAHLDKECPHREEVKSVEEVKYGEFGRSFLNNNGNGARYRVGLPRYYTRIDNRPPFDEKKLSLEE